MNSQLLSYISHFKRLYGQTFQPLTTRFGLSQLEVDILLFLHNNPTYNTARDIVAVRGFAKSNVSNSLDNLHKNGYLSVRPDAKNRKIQRLILSDAMQDRVHALAIRQKRCFARMLGGFTRAERNDLWQYLTRIDHNMLTALQKTESSEKE